jgi:hypothetical protein
MAVSAAELGERALRHIGVAVVPVADRPAMAAPVTLASLATAALTWLAVIASDETPSATDQALALARLTAVHNSLILQGFVSWDGNNVPQGVADEYTLLGATLLGPAFGKAGDMAGVPAIEARIRKAAMIMGAPVLATGSILAVHRNLVARGVARWSINDVPPAAEDPYVMLAGTMMAPEFGLPVIAGDEAAANRTLLQIIALPSSGERVRAEYF